MLSINYFDDESIKYWRAHNTRVFSFRHLKNKREVVVISLFTTQLFDI